LSTAKNAHGTSVTVTYEKVYFTSSRGGQISFDSGAIPSSTLFFTGLSGDEHLYVVAYNLLDGSYQWANGTSNLCAPRFD